ncbi:MAG TPA: PTS galactitol transporter subunit IIC [Firmicutes bacterium]|nr:PTS galactitol transporter subunit IIC [Candidatus Fermentithermobacillaceae bacterium]
MDALLNIVRGILGLGAGTMLPIFITIFGLVFKMGFGKALKSGLLIGIGFQGLNLVVGLLRTTITPVVDVFAKSGQGFTIVDMGWQTLAAAAWATPFAALVVPLGFLLNLALIYAKFTNTLNVDLWNYWHFIFGGTLVYVVTKSYLAGLGFALFLSVLSLKLGDIIAPRWQEYFGVPGTTCTTIYHLTTLQPFAILTNKIVDFIPGLNRWDISPGKIKEKYGMLGEPAIQGLLAGSLLAVIARLKLTQVLQVGVGVSATMILMPRMVSLLMEGLTPIGRAAKASMESRLGGRDLNIGMDIALGLGDPTVITGAILMVPITVGLALVIPGNRYFPLAMLASLAYQVTLNAMWSKGNLLRSILGTSLIMVYTIFAFNYMAPFCTDVVRWAGISTPGLVVGGALQSLPNFIVTVIANLVRR